MTRPSTATVANALRAQLDAECPGWRIRLQPPPGSTLYLIRVVADVSGHGEYECVLHCRGGLEGEALPGEVIE